MPTIMNDDQPAKNVVAEGILEFDDEHEPEAAKIGNRRPEVRRRISTVWLQFSGFRSLAFGHAGKTTSLHAKV